MPIAPTPRHGSRPPADELRALMAEYSLTHRDVAALATVSPKTVESWLAAADATNHRRMHPRHLSLIRHTLPGFLAARGGRKDTK